MLHATHLEVKDKERDDCRIVLLIKSYMNNFQYDGRENLLGNTRKRHDHTVFSKVVILGSH